MIASTANWPEHERVRGLICNNPSKEFHNRRPNSYIAHFCCVLPILHRHVSFLLVVCCTCHQAYVHVWFACIRNYHQTFSMPSQQFHKGMTFLTPPYSCNRDYSTITRNVNTPKYQSNDLYDFGNNNWPPAQFIGLLPGSGFTEYATGQRSL